MVLTFTDRKWHDETTGTVTFPAWAGSTRVTCRITDEALKAVFGASSSATDLVETFERCRASIEGAAIKKYETSGDPLKLVLVSNDFETRAPVKAEPAPKSADEVAEMMKRFRASGAGKSTVSSGQIGAAAAAMAEASGEAGKSEPASESEPPADGPAASA